MLALAKLGRRNCSFVRTAHLNAENPISIFSAIALPLSGSKLFFCGTVCVCVWVSRLPTYNPAALCEDRMLVMYSWHDGGVVDVF